MTSERSLETKTVQNAQSMQGKYPMVTKLLDTKDEYIRLVKYRLVIKLITIFSYITVGQLPLID